MWLHEILATGEPLSKVTEQEMTGKLALLHKRGAIAEMISRFRIGDGSLTQSHARGLKLLLLHSYFALKSL